MFAELFLVNNLPDSGVVSRPRISAGETCSAAPYSFTDEEALVFLLSFEGSFDDCFVLR